MPHLLPTKGERNDKIWIFDGFGFGFGGVSKPRRQNNRESRLNQGCLYSPRWDFEGSVGGALHLQKVPPVQRRVGLYQHKGAEGTKHPLSQRTLNEAR